MKVNINSTFQKGIAACRSSQLEEAKKYFNSILERAPKHPDANHNIGALYIANGRAKEALPFLKTALEVNPKNDQFWLSYITALIQLERFDDAKTILNKAKEIELNSIF